MFKFMTLTTKIIILANCLLLTGCFGPDWNRIRSAQDVAILGMNHASSLTHFDSNGSIHLEKKHQRIDAFKSTHKQLKSFEFLIVPVLNKALRSTSFSVETRRIKPNIDLKNNTYASQLVQKNNVDLGINMTHQFGVIAIPTPPDMRQQYRLALKATIQFADKQDLLAKNLILFRPLILSWVGARFRHFNGMTLNRLNEYSLINLPMIFNG